MRAILRRSKFESFKLKPFGSWIVMALGHAVGRQKAAQKRRCISNVAQRTSGARPVKWPIGHQTHQPPSDILAPMCPAERIGLMNGLSENQNAPSEAGQMKAAKRSRPNVSRQMKVSLWNWPNESRQPYRWVLLKPSFLLILEWKRLADSKLAGLKLFRQMSKVLSLVKPSVSGLNSAELLKRRLRSRL